LTGERAHYELQSGHIDEAERLLAAFEAFAGDSGLIPEQVWDVADIPDRELYFGRAAGSAMPLVWAHAEYVKLRRSLRDGAVFDLPPQTVQRYLVDRIVSGPSLTAQAMVAAVLGATTEWRYDVVSIGYPGPVGADGPVTDPHNLAPGWIGFDFEKAFKRPVRVINDASMQALGGYHGGRMLFLGLG